MNNSKCISIWLQEYFLHSFSHRIFFISPFFFIICQVGLMGLKDSTKYTCDISSESQIIAQTLITCGKGIATKTTTKIYLTQEPPKNPLVGNITIVVGSTIDTVVKDPTKDVLLQVYAPWCAVSKAFSTTYRKVAAAVATVPSLVIAKMDISENDHKDMEIKVRTHMMRRWKKI